MMALLCFRRLSSLVGAEAVRGPPEAAQLAHLQPPAQPPPLLLSARDG